MPGAPDRATAPPVETQGGVDPSPTRTSAAAGTARPEARQAGSSTWRPFSLAGRPTNKIRQTDPSGQAPAGGGPASALQNSLSTAWGATCTFRAPRARTYAVTCDP